MHRLEIHHCRRRLHGLERLAVVVIVDCCFQLERNETMNISLVETKVASSSDSTQIVSPIVGTLFRVDSYVKERQNGQS